MRLLPVLLALMALSCSSSTHETVELPRPEIIPEEEQISETVTLEELFQKHDRLDQIFEIIDGKKARRKEIVGELRELLEFDRKQLRRKTEAIEDEERRLDRLRRKLEARRRDLAEFTGATPENLVADHDELQAEYTGRLNGLDRTKREQADLSESIESREKLADEELFQRAHQADYRSALELMEGFSQDALELVKLRLASPGEERVIKDRLARGGFLAGKALKMDLIHSTAFERSRTSHSSNERFLRAIFLSYVLKLEFEVGKSAFDEISEQQREEFSTFLEDLQENWQESSLHIFIDGHADRRQFRGVKECVSAARNSELSKSRVLEIRDYVVDKIDGAERIHVDWFGNFATRSDSGNSGEDRRIELRVVEGPIFGTSEYQGAHRAYLSFRNEAIIASRSFVRLSGMWVEESCDLEDLDADQAVEYLSEDYGELMKRLSFDPEHLFEIHLGGEVSVFVRLGDRFVVREGERCVEVVPCS